MKTNSNEGVKTNVASSASSAIGAAAGVIAGSVISNELHAAEVVEPIVTPEMEDVPAEAIETGPGVQTESTSEDVQVISSDPAKPVTPVVQTDDVVTTQTPQAQVLATDTVVTEDGQAMDVALVNVDDQDIILVDVDQDGKVDIAMTDLNHNGVVDPGEMEDVSEYDISMDALQAAANDNDGSMIAQNADMDYTNDANVDAYYA